MYQISNVKGKFIGHVGYSPEQGTVSLKFRSTFLSTLYTSLGANLPPCNVIKRTKKRVLTKIRFNGVSNVSCHDEPRVLQLFFIFGCELFVYFMYEKNCKPFIWRGDLQQSIVYMILFG